ncbi:MAG: VCBS repeat-containing protein [Ignavibacteria bacterium]
MLSYTNADFDNDGDIDLAFIVGTYFDYRLKILLNNGNGTFTNGYRGIVPGRVGTGLLKSADIVNDGYNDILIVFGDRFSGVMEIQKNNGNAEFSNGGSFINARCQDQQPLFGEITSFGLCDVNNDGSIDILLESYSSSFNFAGNGINECHTIQIITNNGSGAFSEKIAYSFSEDHNIICTGDFDGDGFVDFMCSGLYMKNNGNGFFTSSPADIIAGAGITGDFEADGDLDIAVLDGNSVRLYKNDGHGIFTGPFNFNTGNGPNGSAQATLLVTAVWISQLPIQAVKCIGSIQLRQYVKLHCDRTGYAHCKYSADYVHFFG